MASADTATKTKIQDVLADNSISYSKIEWVGDLEDRWNSEKNTKKFRVAFDSTEMRNAGRFILSRNGFVIHSDSPDGTIVRMP